MKKYLLEQFPKNKNIENSKLSLLQLAVRSASDAIKLNEEYFNCVKCGHLLPSSEYYKKKDKTRRDKTCRDCRIKASGCLEVGKLRFSTKILRKGFRRCSFCKNIQPLTEYYPSDVKHGRGYSFHCKTCSYDISRNYIKTQKENIGAFFVKQYALKKYPEMELTDSLKEIIRTEIEDRRKAKFFTDGLEFKNITDFSQYIERVYGVKENTVHKRILTGASEDDCKVQTNYEYRKLKSGTVKGTIEVLDTVTNEAFLFDNSNSPQLRKMFSSSAIDLAIKTGKPTTITSLSKYKNPCIIKRILKN